MRFKKPCPAKLSALLLSAMLACGGPVHAETVTETANLIKAALASHGTVKGEITLKTGNAKPVAQRTAGVDAVTLARARASVSSGHATEKAPEHGHDVHWAYEGANGPQAWADLTPDYSACGNGQRQSPIHIQSTFTLQGPAEPLGFRYQPSAGSVINNGHTIQVDVSGYNTLSVRGSTYRLVQFHFHHPAEEMVNGRSFAMVAHLVHRNDQGQLAVVAVLLDPGTANPLVQQVWTHMPLEVNDRVPVPNGQIDLRGLLPDDQRYYQFLGSLTTPPCTEGVLWMVMKQPMTVSDAQLRLFSQLFPMNARPVQPVSGRIVREGL
jgi:carbonic anhydrase